VDARAAAPAPHRRRGFFTTIRRTPDGALQAVPYSLEYQGELERAARLLRERRPLDAAADAARLPRGARRAFLSERLLTTATSPG
jgi:hypothetical protein